MRIVDWNVAPQPQQRWKSARSGKKAGRYSAAPRTVEMRRAIGSSRGDYLGTRVRPGLREQNLIIS